MQPHPTSTRLAILSMLLLSAVMPAAAPAAGKDAVAVQNPWRLPADPIPCERIGLGEPDDYKPCIVLHPSGELLLTAFHQHKREGNKVLEQTLFFRSKDGGKTWSRPEQLDLLGREPYLTVLKDGTIFITGHLLANDVRNKWGYTCGFLHRSIDGGKSWDTTRIESEGIKPKASNHSTRNVLRLADGTLLLGVDYDGGGGPYYVWRSRDNGKTWDKSGKCQPREFKSQYGFFGGETWLWQARSGKIWALVRVDSNEFPMKSRPIQAKNDQADHFILFSSNDGGKTFDRIRDFGDYGEMYMSILRLQDKRLLLTFTVRDLKPPLGVRAIPGLETDDGFDFDFGKDRIMLDARTPVGMYQGGGFGPTVQIQDGTLVTSYSYRGKDDKTHLEVVRWNLPAARTAGQTGYSATGHRRTTIYRSPQKPGFTSWVGAWTMPNGDLMVSFTQATGPVTGRPAAPREVQVQLTWPPAGSPGYDMTGLDMRNVHLRSADAGSTWRRVSADPFKSCMNGVTGEAETALADGTILRGVWGFYLPYNPELPKTGYLERSSDGSRSWGKPELLLDAKKVSAWPKRIRVLRDGRLVVLGGMANVPANSRTRAEYSRLFEPLLLVSDNEGKSWQGPLAVIPAEHRKDWGGEEFDAAELPNGDLLCVFRRVDPRGGGREVRWQGLLRKSASGWAVAEVGPSVLPHSGHPELLATKEGPVLHLATSGVHWTDDAGRTWHKLNIPGTAYYPRAVQGKDGRIYVFGHVGGDDAYGRVDQSIVMDTFRLERQ